MDAVLHGEGFRILYFYVYYKNLYIIVFWHISVTRFVAIIPNIWEMLIGNHLGQFFLFITHRHISFLPYNFTIGEAVEFYDTNKNS